MMVTCSMEKIQQLQDERDDWIHVARELQKRVLFLEQKVLIAEEVVRAVSELQQVAQGALAVGEPL